MGDKAAILREWQGPEGRTEVSFLTVHSFREWLRPRRVMTRLAGQGAPKQVSLAQYWLSHPDRREFEGVTFIPGGTHEGLYNLWRGFAVDPEPGDCSLFLQHIRDVICSGDEELSEWVTDWFAQIFQKPKRKPGDNYNTCNYRRAIYRACDKAGLDHWAPNRLRHTAATELRRKYGIEMARTVLGHSDVATTAIYAEADRKAAANIMREVG